METQHDSGDLLWNSGWPTQDGLGSKDPPVSENSKQQNKGRYRRTGGNGSPGVNLIYQKIKSLGVAPTKETFYTIGKN